MVGSAELRHNMAMRFALVAIALLAGCGVQIDGDKNASDGSTDSQARDAAIDAPVRPCTGGDMNMTVGNQCFVLFTGTPRTWADANTACTNMQAHLAILDTAAKHTAAKTRRGAARTFKARFVVGRWQRSLDGTRLAGATNA